MSGLNEQVAPFKSSKIKALSEEIARTPAPSKQFPLALAIEVERRIDGIEMGVLENGMPYLSQVGLASMSGSARATIFEISKEWEEKFDDPIAPKGRISFLKDFLFKNGYEERKLYLEIVKDGSVHYAYPDIVCTALIEYFAFEAQKTNVTAIENYRRLARFGLQKFIYESLEYTPSDKWKYFNDRVSLLKETAPEGYFIIFNEITGIAVDLINANLSVNDKTLPDISVGKAWGSFWSENDLDSEFGERIKYERNYPDYYPQALSNPQTPWAYPDESLPLFRKWLRTQYLTTKFPRYILTKAKVLRGGRVEAEQIASIYVGKQLPGTP